MNQVIKMSNKDFRNRRKQNQIENWLIGLEKESGLFKEEPEIPQIILHKVFKQIKKHKKYG